MLTKLISAGDKVELQAVEKLREEAAQENKKIYYSISGSAGSCYADGKNQINSFAGGQYL